MKTRVWFRREVLEFGQWRGDYGQIRGIKVERYPFGHGWRFVVLFANGRPEWTGPELDSASDAFAFGCAWLRRVGFVLNGNREDIERRAGREVERLDAARVD